MSGLEFIMAARAFAGERFSSKGATLDLGRRIVNREVVGGESPEDPFVNGETIYAYTADLWLRRGLHRTRLDLRRRRGRRHYMPVGDDRRWRTWSRHRLGRGEYVVEVFAPDGKRLARKSFTAF